VKVNDQLSIPDNELTITASRSGGPGGQNVNKVSSRVTVSFEVLKSPSLTPDQRRQISTALAGRLSKEGVLRVVSQRTRSQEMNRQDAIGRLADLIGKALTIKPMRVPTSVPAAAQARRLDDKKKRTLIKQSRAKQRW